MEQSRLTAQQNQTACVAFHCSDVEIEGQKRACSSYCIEHLGGDADFSNLNNVNNPQISCRAT